MIGTLPFWMVGIQVLWFGNERFGWRHAAGLTLGFAGISCSSGPISNPRTRPGAGFCWALPHCKRPVVAGLCGSVYSKGYAIGGDPLGASALQMFFGGAFMLAVGTIHGEWADLHFSTRTLAALGYLVLAGSVVAFVAYNYALKHLPVSFVSLYAYVNPVVAVALGTALLGEPFTLRTAMAIVVILGGVALVKMGGSH